MRFLSITYPSRTCTCQHRQAVFVSPSPSIPDLLSQSLLPALPLKKLGNMLSKCKVSCKRRIEDMSKAKSRGEERLESLENLAGCNLRSRGEGRRMGSSERSKGLGCDRYNWNFWVRRKLVLFQKVEYFCVGLEGDEYRFCRGYTTALCR